MSHGSLLRQGKRVLHRCLTRQTPQKHCCLSHQTRCLSHQTRCLSHQTRCLSHQTPQLQQQGALFPSTSLYKITPATQTQVTLHDVKAAAITKALYVDCLPPGIDTSDATNEFHKTFNKTIFETFFFEPTERIRSNVKNRHPNTAVVNGIYAQLQKLLYAKLDFTKCKVTVDRLARFQHPFYRTTPDYPTPVPFLVEGDLSYSILSDTPARPLFSVEQCAQTAEHPVEWAEMMRTTLDIEESFVTDNLVLGDSSRGLPNYPYCRVILDTAPGAEWSDGTRARGIYFLFARLASEAIRDGYSPGDVLDTPKVGVFISSSAYSYHVVFFQLNTLDLVSTGGVKNIAWGQSIDNITSSLVPYKMVTPENLLGPHVLGDACDLIKTGVFYDLPTRGDVFVE